MREGRKGPRTACQLQAEGGRGVRSSQVFPLDPTNQTWLGWDVGNPSQSPSYRLRDGPGTLLLLAQVMFMKPLGLLGVQGSLARKSAPQVI